MKKTFLILICLCITVILQGQVQITLKHASKAPVIDGYIDGVDDPWSTLIPLTVRNPASTTSGMTAKFQILTSSDAFYVAVVVEDATPSNDATAIVNSYERDCSEIFFSMDTVTEANGAYKAGCWQIRTQREGELLIDGNSGANTWSVATLTADPNFKVVSETSATEYIQELILPFSILTAGMEPAWNYKFFRFDIAVADNTTGVAGGRTEQRYWYGHNGLGDDHGWDNTRSLGVVKLPSCCGDYEVWEVSPATISIAALEGSNSTVNIISSVAWTATSDQTWLQVSPAIGTGNSTVTLTAGVNKTNETRKATITVKGSGAPSKTITVTQAAGTVGVPSEMEENMKIYPNPLNDFFSISGLEEQATICVTDLNGRLLLTKQISGNEMIPVSSLSPGLYFVKVITDVGTIKKKLVKQ
jgi:hypothetical protein